jgi:hypothetical protein
MHLKPSFTSRECGEKRSYTAYRSISPPIFWLFIRYQVSRLFFPLSRVVILHLCMTGQPMYGASIFIPTISLMDLIYNAYETLIHDS